MRRPNPAAIHLSNYWNALNRDAPAEELARLAELVEPASLRAIERVRALHQPHQPDPAFLARLETLAMDTFTATPLEATSVISARPPTANRRFSSSPVPAGWGWSTRRLRRSFVPALEVALIIVLVLGSLGILWTTTRDDRRVIAPGDATPTAESTPVQPPDVPMYRGNPERTGVMPGPGIDGAPSELWRLEFDGIASAPAVVNGILYFGVGNGEIRAVAASTEEDLWTFTASSPIGSHPAVVDGVVYIGGDDGVLHALDAMDGSEVWSFPDAAPDTSVAVVGGVVYTGSAGGDFLALDSATGTEIWRSPLGEGVSRHPAVASGVVFVGGLDGVLHTFDASTGEPGWTFQTEGGGTLGTTAVANGLVYQATFEGEENHAYGLDAETGEVVWRFETESGQGFFPPAVNDDLVILPGSDGTVYALDAMTGEPAWSFITGDRVNAAPALVGDVLYVASNDDFVYAVDTNTGMELWRFAVAGEVWSGPIVTGGVAYVSTNSGVLHAIGGGGEGVATPEVVASPLPATPVEEPATPQASPEAPAELATFVWEVGGGDEPPAQPTDVTVAPDGTVWIVDRETSELHQFGPDGTLLATHVVADFIADSSTGSISVGALAFDDPGNAYVLDTGNHRVLKFDPDWSLILEWGGPGTGNGQFQNPSDLEVDSQGHVYVNDWGRSDVQKFDSDGIYLATVDAAGAGEAAFPGDLARIGIDADDNLYLPSGSRVFVFAPDGSFIRSFGEGHLGFAVDAAADVAGNVFVSDAEKNQVQVYDPAGTLIGAWGTFGQMPGEFIEADALALDGMGNIYVVDFVNERVQKFAVSPPPVPDATPVAATPIA